MDGDRLQALSGAQSDLDRAVVAFARWQGLTNDTDLQRNVAKAELDALILRMEPEEWSGLCEHVELLGEENTRKLMSYSLRHAMADLDDLSREVKSLPEWTMDRPQDDESEGAPSPSRKRRRDREP